jgi:hypothetical protein
MSCSRIVQQHGHDDVEECWNDERSVGRSRLVEKEVDWDW